MSLEAIAADATSPPEICGLETTWRPCAAARGAAAAEISRRRMVRVPGILAEGRAVMMAQRFGVGMRRRGVEKLTRFQWIKRRSHRPPGSTWDSVSLVHPCGLPVK